MLHMLRAKREAGASGPHVRAGSEAGVSDPHGAARASKRAGRRAAQQAGSRERPDIRVLPVPFQITELLTEC
jgi:hypothetical protein